MAEVDITIDELPEWTDGDHFEADEDHKDLRVQFKSQFLSIRASYDTIEFKPRCIVIKIEPDHIYLESYYYKKAIEECPKLDHATFFDFLKELGSIYERNVVLDDDSSKTFHNTNCGRIYSEIFALAGNLTFYERFGFFNDEFRERVKFLEKLTLEQLLSLRKRRHARRHDHKTIHALKLMSQSGMSLDVDVKTFASFLIDQCKHSEQHNKEYNRRESMSAARTRRFNRSYETSDYGFLISWFMEVIRELNQSVNPQRKMSFTQKKGGRQKKTKKWFPRRI